MTKILITGSKGQLGSEILELAPNYHDYSFYFTDVEQLDITNKNKVDEFVSRNNINIIINCAAYTAVDNAETDKKNAKLLNVTAVKYLAQISAKYDILLVHISTDYVFNGMAHTPYKETSPVFTNSVYGKTKLDGENELMEFATKAVIIRTSWLYSSYGKNFLKTMIKYGKEKEQLNVVSDQIGTPTYAADLAKTILDILPKIADIEETEIYHYSNEGVASWYDFAIEIMSIAKIKCKINPIETKDYPLPSPRPQYGILNKSKIKKELAIEIPYWKDSLKKCIEKINNN